MSRPEMFVHFTTEADAAAIVASGVLFLSRVFSNTVFAAAVGGANVPGVQHKCRTEDGDFLSFEDSPECRSAAVLFTTDADPWAVFPEEVLWKRDTPLPLSDATVISAAEAEALLDGSAGITDGWAW